MDFINELIRERKSLVNRIDAIDLLLKSYDVISETTNVNDNNSKISSSSNDESIVIDYKEELKSLSDSNKFLLVLKKHQRFMKVREIGEFINSQIGGSTNDWVTKLSRRTKNLKEANKIVKKQIGNKKTNVFWGSPKWLKSNDEIKNQYMYDESSVNGKQSLFDI